MVVLFGIAAFWMIYALVARQPLFSDWTLARTQLSATVALIMMYPTLTKAAFQFFQCSEAIEGKRLLIADAEIFCWSVLERAGSPTWRAREEERSDRRVPTGPPRCARGGAWRRACAPTMVSFPCDPIICDLS